MKSITVDTSEFSSITTLRRSQPPDNPPTKQAKRNTNPFDENSQAIIDIASSVPWFITDMTKIILTRENITAM